MSALAGAGSGPGAPGPATVPVTVRVAEPHEYDAVGSLLLEAFTSRFWVTRAYRESLADIEGHLAAGEELLVAVGSPGGAGPSGPAGTADSPEPAGEGEGGEGELLGAVFAPRSTGRGPDGVVEQSFARLGVAPAAAGRGVARALVEAVEDIARRRGARRMAIRSGPQMHAAHRMYEHLGYLRRPERETLVVDSGQRLLVYTRELEDPAGSGNGRSPIPPWTAGPTPASLAEHAAELDRLLATRRYLNGDRITAADRGLLAVLLPYDQIHRPEPPDGAPSPDGARAPRLSDYPHLWAYARDLVAAPGLVGERELVDAGILTGPDGAYAGPEGRRLSPEERGDNPLARWTEPAGREHLGGGPPTRTD